MMHRYATKNRCVTGHRALIDNTTYSRPIDRIYGQAPHARRLLRHAASARRRSTHLQDRIRGRLLPAAAMPLLAGAALSCDSLFTVVPGHLSSSSPRCCRLRRRRTVARGRGRLLNGRDDRAHGGRRRAERVQVVLNIGTLPSSPRLSRPTPYWPPLVLREKPPAPASFSPPSETARDANLDAGVKGASRARCLCAVVSPSRWRAAEVAVARCDTIGRPPPRPVGAAARCGGGVCALAAVESARRRPASTAGVTPDAIRWATRRKRLLAPGGSGLPSMPTGGGGEAAAASEGGGEAAGAAAAAATSGSLAARPAGRGRRRRRRRRRGLGRHGRRRRGRRERGGGGGGCGGAGGAGGGEGGGAGQGSRWAP